MACAIGIKPNAGTGVSGDWAKELGRTVVQAVGVRGVLNLPAKHNRLSGKAAWAGPAASSL